MIILKDYTLKHRANIKAAKKLRKVTRRNLNYGTVNGLNDKGKKKYTKLQSKTKKLVNKNYNNMEVGYQNNKHRYSVV